MSIYDTLYQLQDQRREQPVCQWNLYLEDYLMMIEHSDPKVYESLSKFVQYDPTLRICVNLSCSFCKDGIANQIIHYKDAYRLEGNHFQIPYIIYGLQNKQRALLLCLGEKDAYILAKGYYYLISEPNNFLENYRNDILAVAFDASQEWSNSIPELFQAKIKTGKLQRMLDRTLFPNYDAMYEYAIQMANQNNEAIQGKMEEKWIYKYIQICFLLKKFCYVQTMLDKHQNMQEQDAMKQQRQLAKQRSNQIQFIPYHILCQFNKQ